MPFKLKLKKTRQYNVASKSLFVISVELLDGGVADCTLSVDSSGLECLDNVCQRQAINQPEFFGLRYLNRNCQPRWVQLERPLKRQLDKYASAHQLYLRVMYYVISGTSLITDEVTRYHYFLQLKNDLIEGRISCDCQQAVVLASYSRQAEYGNHDRERHTVEYLKNLLTFPKQIHDGNQIIDVSNRAESGWLERLTSAVIQHHMALHNMSQAQAEEGFITTCQQLPGYGQETFSARDQRTQKEVTLAISITGIKVITDSPDTTRYYRWMDITNVINHKRTFSIECLQQAESASFILWSPEDGKDVWRMCVQQHTFYMQHQKALSDHPTPNTALASKLQKALSDHPTPNTALASKLQKALSDHPTPNTALASKLQKALSDHPTPNTALASKLQKALSDHPTPNTALASKLQKALSDHPTPNTALASKLQKALSDHQTPNTALASKLQKALSDHPTPNTALASKLQKALSDHPTPNTALASKLQKALSDHPTPNTALASKLQKALSDHPTPNTALASKLQKALSDHPTPNTALASKLQKALSDHPTPNTALASKLQKALSDHPTPNTALASKLQKALSDHPTPNTALASKLQQHTFYMQHQKALSDHPTPNTALASKLQQDHCLSDSREELDTREAGGSALGSVARLEPLSAAHRAHSTSCLELAEQRPQVVHRNRALLPSYRPAPDYETAIQQKYQQQRAEAQLRYQSHPHQPLAYGSHPDIHRVHYPDVTRHTLSVNQVEDYHYGLNILPVPFAVNPNVQTERNPKLQYINVYKPPPPYPSNGLASNSTPDLALASQAMNYHRGYINSHVSGSSPDLVSTRTVINRQYLGYINPGTHNVVNYPRPNILPNTHGTYNNLNSVVEPNPHIIMDPHHISDSIQKVYDERGNIMYSMPMHRVPYQRHRVVPQQPIKLADAREPIYENVPLPWLDHSKNTMRDRAHSLTTTDEIARLNERNSSHPTINSYGINNASYPKVSINIQTPDSHYVNAQVIKGVRESSVPKDLNSNKQEFENITLAVDRLSLQHEDNNDETPYQSLSTHKVNNNITKSADNVTSINVSDVSNLTNSTFTSVEIDSANSSKSTVSGKEKKRRRWGVFMGRGNAKEVKSATLGRARAEPRPAHTHRWSTGLPKAQPLPPSITKETLCQLLERKMSDDQLSFAFDQIPKGRSGASAEQFKTALLPQHASINGNSLDSLPYEDNRVRLHPSPQNPCGYINASHITMTVGSTQQFYVVGKVSSPPHPPPAAAAAPAGCSCGGHCPLVWECAWQMTVGSTQQFYVVGKVSSPPHPPPAAAAAPAGCSCGGHCPLVWECAWQVGARLVAFVDEKRPHYLPADNRTHQYGQFQVSCGTSSTAPWGSSALVTIRRAGSPAPRRLWHVHYRSWGPLPAPADVAAFREFLSEMNALRLSCEAGEWCSPAAGRSAPLVLLAGAAPRAGLALAAHLLAHILDHSQELDIPRTISLLQQQRANLIENVHQYKFLHQVLLHYLKQSRLI
nr:unnamed protein product [Amyelois transitella]